MPRTPQTELRRVMTLLDVVSLGIGASVGVAIYSILAPAAALAGTGLLAAVTIAAVPMVIFAVVYAFMGSTVPRSGASYDWPARFVHPKAGFAVAWLRIFGDTAALIVLTRVLAVYLSQIVPMPQRPTMLVLLLLFCAINLVGVHVAAGVERVLVAAKLIALAVFMLLGLSAVESANFHSVPGPGLAGTFAAVPLLMSLYLGIESAVEVGEEIKDATSTIGKGLAIAAVIAVVLYLGVSAITLGVLGSRTLSASQAPLFDAGSRFLGRWNTPVVSFAAVAAIGTTINAIYLTFTRFLFAMGQDRVLPAILANIHPRWATPHVAILVVFGCGVLGLLLPSSLLFLFLAVNLPSMVQYFFNCLAAARLVAGHPALLARARLLMKRGTVTAWAFAGMLASVVLFVAGFTVDWRPYAILAGWAAVGVCYWRVRGRHAGRLRDRHQDEADAAAELGSPPRRNA